MLYIHSPAFFDERALTVMGMSAKTSSSAIGKFGTGLKYAVAITLRLGGSIVIRRASAPDITFSAKPDEFRGKSFHSVLMHIGDAVTQLPFTLDYGQTWEAWMVYRELVSNAYDEGGDVSETPVKAETVIELSGLSVSHRDAFLPKGLKLHERTEDIEIYKGSSSFIYYRGIRAGQARDSNVTINLLADATLSEERLLRDGFAFSTVMETLLRRGTFDQCCRIIPHIHGLSSWFIGNPSIWGPSGLAFAAHHSAPACISLPYQKWKSSQINYAAILLSQKEEEKLASALALIAPIAPELSRGDLIFCEHLGEALGAVYSDQIYISRRALLEGRDSLAATLYEEYLHKFQGLPDESRSMQEHLLKTIIGAL